jgi:hypothetical protein
MIRECTSCHKPFTPQELSREETKGMEAERKALGLQGILFRYYTCSQCGQADIFVDILPLPGESDEDFRHRRDDLEKTVRQLQAEKVAVVVVEK